MSIQDKPNLGKFENSVEEILKKLSTTQRQLAEKLKALGVKLGQEEKIDTPESEEGKEGDKSRPND